MKILVAGSSGHLGEALMRMLPGLGHQPVGVDVKPGEFTDHVGSIVDPDFVAGAMDGCEATLHVATLHKPHVATHGEQEFIDVNVSGTLNLLQAAAANGVRSFVFASTTSAFGAALTPPAGAPAVWIDEDAPSIPKNIYGATKTAAEGICELYARRRGLNCLILRVSRFFPEDDDDKAKRDAYSGENAKANEYLFRRADLEDVATAHVAAMNRAEALGFGRYVVSATTPFRPEDAAALNRDAPAVVEARAPGFADAYAAKGYAMFPTIERVYDNARARRDLRWRPTYDFARVLAQIKAGEPIGSDLSRQVGSKGYHDQVFADGPYPVRAS